MTNDEQREITLPKAKSARGEVAGEVRCGAGEVPARFGRDTGEMQPRRDGGRGRDPNEIQARVTGRVAPAARSAGGESTRSANPNPPSGAGSSGGSRTATGARQRSAGEKEKGGGVSLAPSEPHAPPPRHRPCCLLWPTFATTWGGARRSRPGGWGRPRPRAPPRAAPTRHPSSAIRTTAAGGGRNRR